MAHLQNHNLVRRRLKRLCSLQGSDPGIFLLAAHSFVEAYLRESLQDDSPESTFPDLLFNYHDGLTSNARGYIAELNVLGQFRRRHPTANHVRHAFAEVSAEETVAVVHDLLRFCILSGISAENEVQELQKSLELWKDNRSMSEALNELNRKGFELVQAMQREKELQQELAAFRERSREHDETSERIRVLQRELEKEKARAERQSEKADKLRAERRELQERRRRLEQEMAELQRAGEYVQHLSRMTAYTRTRLEYERSMVRMTREQERVLEQIKLDGDFLVKGGAGTGKTLVLLKALEKAVTGAEQELALEEEQGTIAFLTYTNTLVKYDKYLAAIMSGSHQAEELQTVDKFLGDRFASLGAGRIEFSAVSDLVKELGTGEIDFLSVEELAVELEEFLFGGLVTHEEYCESMIERSGRKYALGKVKRSAVWAYRELVVRTMQERGVYSKNYSRLMLIEAAADAATAPVNGAGVDQSGGIRWSGGDSGQKVDWIFLDEAQDLSSADLAALKLFARRGMILAGDSDQSIYRAGFALSRSGIDIRGRTRILRTNFRNTRQIHEAAEAFRALKPASGFDPDNQPEAFRDGPHPELFELPTPASIYEAVAARARFFIDELGYEPENIAVLTNDKSTSEKAVAVLSTHGLRAAPIRDYDFAFDQPGVVRVSTLHSSKGLDFPVVLLALAKQPFVGNAHAPEAREAIMRNLLYVAATRAMDHLNVFVRDSADSKATSTAGSLSVAEQDLIEVLRAGDDRA
ncbi:MAG: hypothetical protein EA428_00195 [Spirochaetaceae bacterium]|nr:MAG: hypothetical protein EA428_00195 [Spirochaetaceae bacterium]